MYSSTLISGSIYGKSNLNSKSNLARSSTNDNSGAISGNQIGVVRNNFDVEEHQEHNIDLRRNAHGNPDPEEEVVVLSPNSLTNKYPIICEICKKGFQRGQNLELHKRLHKLPFNLKKKAQIDNKKKVYLCPIPTCLRHHRSRALGDVSGIKKHYSRKHCPKTIKCLKCSKPYAVQSDMRAHMINCGTSDYKCDCGLLFQRLDSYNRHQKLCEAALAAETIKASTSYPQLETSSQENSTNYKTMDLYLGNIPPHGVFPIPQGFPSINHYHQQASPAKERTLLENVGNTKASSSSDISIKYTFPGEPHHTMTTNNPSINQVDIKDSITHVLPLPNELLPPQFDAERNDKYTMCQANLQDLLGTGSADTWDTTLLEMVNMICGTSVENYVNGGGEGGVGDGDGVALPIDRYYHELPTRNFHSTSKGDDCRVGLGEGSEWVTCITKHGNDQQHYVNGHQFSDFAGGPSTSTSRMTNGSQGRNSQE